MTPLHKLNELAESHGELRPGHGMISGVIALALAILCFLGVLAFHFPEYLTTPQLRKTYNVDVMRQVMLAALVLAGSLSLYNIIRGRARWLALGAFVLIGLTLMLGGHKVPVNDFADNTPYIGLDWFILDLLGSTLIFIFIEKLFALRRDQPVFRAEWQTDFHHFIVNHMVVGFVLLATNLLVHKLFGWAAKDGVRFWVQDLPFVAALFLIVLVADLVQYWTHRAYHEVPLLWRLHAVHHSVKSMDWLAGSRQHIIELIITRTLVLAPIYVLGFQQGSDRRLHHHRRLPGGVQPRQRERAARAAALPDRHAQLPPLAPFAGRRGDRPELRRPLRLPRPPVRHRGAVRPQVARTLRRAGRLRAQRLLQAAAVSVHLEGLSRAAPSRAAAHTAAANCQQQT